MNKLRKLLLNELSESISDKRVLKAMGLVPRERFVSDDYENSAYLNQALPIECDQTISQPYVVAKMTEAIIQDLKLHSVLEIGTGSGYQAAILAQLFDHVYTVERIEFLYIQAKRRFEKQGYSNIRCLLADGNQGWVEHAPYDAIIVTAAAKTVPPGLLLQLASNGRMIIPLGDSSNQTLYLIKRTNERFDTEILDSVVFVPLKKGIE